MVMRGGNERGRVLKVEECVVGMGIEDLEDLDSLCRYPK